MRRDALGSDAILEDVGGAPVLKETPAGWQVLVDRLAHERVREAQRRPPLENEGEVCPAGWEPGQPTLTPGLELVGQL